MARPLPAPTMILAADDRRTEWDPETTMTAPGTRTLLRTTLLGASTGDARANRPVGTVRLAITHGRFHPQVTVSRKRTLPRRGHG